MFDRVLVPLDGSQLAEAAIPAAEQIAKRFEGKLFLLRVAPPVDLSPWMAPGSPATEEEKLSLGRQERTEADEYLSAIVDRLIAEGITVEATLRQGDAAEEILALIKSKDISLLVMATHGRGGLSKLIFGSVAEKVSQNCQIPVLLVHGADV